MITPLKGKSEQNYWKSRQTCKLTAYVISFEGKRQYQKIGIYDNKGRLNNFVF